MAKMQAAAQGGPVVDEAAMEEMRRLILKPPSRNWQSPREFPLTRRYSFAWRKPGGRRGAD